MTPTKDDIIQAIKDVTARRVQRVAYPGIVRIFRNAHDQVCVEVLDEGRVA